MKENVCRNVYVCITIASPHSGGECKRTAFVDNSHLLFFFFLYSLPFFKQFLLLFSLTLLSGTLSGIFFFFFFFLSPIRCYRTIRCCMSHIILENGKENAAVPKYTHLI